MSAPQTARRLAVVTGAGGVIGGAIAGTLCSSGFDLILHVHEKKPAVNGVPAINEGGNVEIISCDFTAPAERKIFIDVLLKRSVSVLVNNAGIVAGSPLFAASTDESSRVIDVSYTASAEISKAFLPGMIERGFGRIINVSSIAALTGDAGRSAYAAAKAALVGLTRRLSRKTHGQVTVNALLPGFVSDTPAVNALSAEKVCKILETIPAGRMSAPSEIASFIAFLVSDAASHVNGAVLPIDGALLAQTTGAQS